MNKFERLTLFDFKTYYKTAIIKTLGYWYPDRQRDQWNRIEFRNGSTQI